MGKWKLSFCKHPQDEQIQATGASEQQMDRWTLKKGAICFIIPATYAWSNCETVRKWPRQQTWHLSNSPEIAWIFSSITGFILLPTPRVKNKSAFWGSNTTLPSPGFLPYSLCLWLVNATFSFSLFVPLSYSRLPFLTLNGCVKYCAFWGGESVRIIKSRPSLWPDQNN